VRPSPPIAVAAERYLNAPRTRPLGTTSVNVVKETVRLFGLAKLRDVKDHAWSDWVDQRMVGNASSTRERFLNSLVSFLNWCAKKPRRWCEVPTFDRDNAARNPRRRARRPVQDLRIDLIRLLVEHAAPHLKAQIWTEWSTGARVSSILHGCRLCDLILAPGREQITFHDTKNGQTVTAHLHPIAVEALRQYLSWRGNLHDREGPLFLTDAREPFSLALTSGQNRTAFNGMKRRARRALRRQGMARARAMAVGGQREKAAVIVAQLRRDHRLIKNITQHWFRHNLATKMRGNIRDAMDQGGWIDERSVLGYMTDVPEHRRGLVNVLDIDFDQSPTKADTPLTRSAPSATKNKTTSVG